MKFVSYYDIYYADRLILRALGNTSKQIKKKYATGLTQMFGELPN